MRPVKTLGFLIVLWGIGCKAQELNYDEMQKIAQLLSDSIKSKNDQLIMKHVRDLVKSMPSENVKMIGLDLKDWAVRIGTATYLEGEFTDMTLNPFWPSMKNYAHVLHNSGSRVPGIGYIQGETHITKEKAIPNPMTGDQVPSIATKVIVHGEGRINVDGIEETPERCRNLKRDLDEIIDTTGEHVDEQTLLVLTDEYYCPSYLQKVAKKVYQLVKVESGYANDGTPVDVISGTIEKARQSQREEAKRNSWIQKEYEPVEDEKDFQ